MTADPLADVTLLDELEAARAAATPGPWIERQDFIDQGVPDNSKTLNAAGGDYVGTVALTYRGEDNAALIVAAVNHLHALLAAVRAGLALADELEAAANLPTVSDFDRGVAAHERDLAARLRDALTAPLGHGDTEEEV